MSPNPNYRIDAVASAAREVYNFDAAESMNFARELLNVRAQAFEQLFPEMKAMSLVPMKNDIDPADEEYTYQAYSQVGKAALVSSYSSNAPRSDVFGTEATPLKIRGVVSAYGYSFQEARAAAKLKKNLDQRKANAARRSIAQELNDTFSFGSTKFGTTMYGIANLSGTVTYTVTTGTAGSKTFALKTSDEMIVDLNGIVTKVVVDSNDVEHPNTMVLPLSTYELIVAKRMGDGSDTTVLKHFLANNPHIKTVVPWYALESAPNSEWTGRRIMVYDRNPDKLEGILPVEFEQFAPQMVNMETVTTCHARIGGIALYYPKSVAYGDGV